MMLDIEGNSARKSIFHQFYPMKSRKPAPLWRFRVYFYFAIFSIIFALLALLKVMCAKHGWQTAIIGSDILLPTKHAEGSVLAAIAWSLLAIGSMCLFIKAGSQQKE
jgi:hypothetical protein